ncbi:Spc7 kinetochore protein-domain-containing protein [Flagelloscypha sp. PMI_526]|nr:Spc7 kinetochore protein-domain-containing protein [Flagelloscypha sp. PMI_526]
MVSDQSDKRRRKSTASIQHARPGNGHSRRRRAHSMVGGNSSPLARRSLQPRKSILKMPAVTIVPDGTSLSTRTDDSHGTESMEITRHELLSRKSMSRRVSFAHDMKIRVFSAPDTSVSTVSTEDSPQSSPARPPQVTNENDYPRASSRPRRSSMRTSIGTQDMDITGQYEFSSDGDYSSDAPTPQGSPSKFLRDQTMSSLPDESMAESELEADRTQHMEFTMPMGRALKPAHEDPAYVALMNATHAGPSLADEDLSSGSLMDLSEAQVKVGKSRASFSGGNVTHDVSAQDETMSSVDTGELDDMDDGNQTMNLTKLLQRASFGGLTDRTSLAPSDMDITTDFTTTNTFHSTPRPSLAPGDGEGDSPFKVDVAAIEKPRATSSAPSSPRKLTVPRPFVFSRPSTSPSKEKGKDKANAPPSPTKTRPQFSAAFAPPVTKPSPKKASTPLPPQTSPSKIPSKRSREVENDLSDAGRPSPAKRQALADKWSGTAVAHDADDDAASLEKPKRLSPSKRAPFQPQSHQPSGDTTSHRASSKLPQPSNNLARRKSFIPAPSTAKSSTSLASGTLAAGRQSLGSAPSQAWLKFDRNAPAPSIPAVKPIVPQPGSSQPSPREHSAKENIVPEPSGLSQDESLPTPANVEATERWRSEVVVPPEEEEPETPQISIKQFFEMTGINFMDEIQAPRRSTHARQSVRTEPRQPEEIPLAEYAIALGRDIPQIRLFNRVTEDLEGWIQQSKKFMKQAEEDVAQLTPELFVEFLAVEEAEQSELLHQLKLIKTNTRVLAKSDWYDWKHTWIEELAKDASQVFENLQKDANELLALQEEVNTVLPDLQERYRQVMAQLQQEEEEVAQIESCDQEYLKELKTDIQGQSLEVESLRVEHDEQLSQLKWLEDRLVTIEQEEKETNASMTELRRQNDIRMNSTQLDVFRLRDELETLETLHLTRITKVQPHLFEFIYASQFRVVIPCKGHVPIMRQVQLHWIPDSRPARRDSFPGLRKYFLEAARQHVLSQRNLTTQQIVQLLVDFWSSCGQLRRHLEFLQTKCPVELQFAGHNDSAKPGLVATASVLFEKLRARAEVDFDLPLSALQSWPQSFHNMTFSSRVIYGPLNPNNVQESVGQSLMSSRPESNDSWFHDACSAALDLCQPRS